MNKNIWKIVTVSFLTLLLVAFTHCVPTAPEGTTGAVRSPSSGGTPTPIMTNTPEAINQMQVSVGIKNHEQILHTFAALTGVAASSDAIQTVYQDLKESLPTDNDIKVFLAPQQIAV